MTMLAYITKECIEDARTHGISSEIEKLISRVETEQSTRLFDHFPSDYIVKKKFGHYNNRVIGKHIIIECEEHGEIDIVVFLRVLIRGSLDYRQFSSSADTYGENHLTPLINIDEITDWCKNRLAVSPATPLPKISDSEYGFLYGALHQRSGSSYISESHEWFYSVTQDSMREYLRSIGEYLEKVASDKIPGIITGKIGPLSITTRYFPDSDTLTLIDATQSIAKSELLNLPDAANGEEIDQYCRRKYPDYILADIDFWINIEKDKAGNLALSPEESSVLDSVRQSEVNPFPLFINGRAGSGKSTIIQYIYCDLMRYWLQHKPTPEPPIYLTYNKSLMESAKSTVASILRHDVNGNNFLAEEFLASHQSQIDSSLKEFHEFLYSHLTHEDIARFPRNSRMTFSRFKSEWIKSQANNPASSKLGPDLCWHILRTFIKGFEPDVETYFDAEDYEGINSGDKTNISNETFEYVYKNIFERWYKNSCSHEENTEYWDDQDLVRYLISNERLKPLRPAIICDEAQDFTRIELDAIMRLSLFSNRSLSRQDVSKIPLVFAGDQFQTLNPTGFRWESVKAWFVENFIHKLDPVSKRSDINYKELCFNYRSTAEIVRFSNLIQYQRGSLFNTLGEVEPQHPWSKKRDIPVMRFSPNDSKLWERVASSMNNAVIIIPCDDDEVQSYIRGDQYLWEFIPRDGDTPLMPVISPSRAKGLEFQDVILYRFGHQHACGNFDYKNRRLEAEYFINRLYVGVTRPKKRLLILDSSDDLSFWNFARNPEATESDISRRNSNIANRWKDCLSHLIEGDAERLNSSASISEYEDTAKQVFESGFMNRDAYLMRQASIQYRLASKDQKSRESLAWAAAFDGRSMDAAIEFENAGMWKESAQQLFVTATIESWERLYRLSSTHQDISREPYLRLIDALLNNSAQWIDAVNNFGENLEQGIIPLDDDSLCIAWAELIHNILSHNKESAKPEQLEILLNVMINAQKQRITIADDIIGSTAFLLKKWQIAIDYWDKSGNSRSPDYKIAKRMIDTSTNRPQGNQDVTSEKLSKVIDEFTESIKSKRYSDAISLVSQENILSATHRKLWLEALASYDCTNEINELTLIADICEGSFDISNWPSAEKMDAFLPVIKALSVSSQLTKLDESKRQRIAAIIFDYWSRHKPHLIPSDGKEFDNDSIDHLFCTGSSIERSGNRNDAVSFYKDIRRCEQLGKYKGYIESRLFRCEMRRAKAKNDSRTMGEIMRRNPGKTEKGIEEYPTNFSIDRAKDELIERIHSKLQAAFDSADPSSTPTTDPSDIALDQANKKTIEESCDTQPLPTNNGNAFIASSCIKENFLFNLSGLKVEGWSKTQKIHISDNDGRLLRINLLTQHIQSDDFSQDFREMPIVDEWGISISATDSGVSISFSALGVKFVI